MLHSGGFYYLRLTDALLFSGFLLDFLSPGGTLYRNGETLVNCLSLHDTQNELAHFNICKQDIFSSGTLLSAYRVLRSSWVLFLS